MKLSDYLENAKIDNSVENLMTPGLAVEFIQPWYTPLSTTPSTTGIAVGGIGSTFTVSPAGSTPVMNAIPGVQIRADLPKQLCLNNFFFREAIVEKTTPLKIYDFQAFQLKNGKYTLKDKKGENLFQEKTVKEAEEKLKKVIADKTFFKTNEEAFARWKTEWSDKTQRLFSKGNNAELNRSILIDFFEGSVGFENAREGALTAAWGEETTYLGKKGYNASQMHYRALYPVSETLFKGKGAQIKRTQYSYVVPKDERLSSLPISATEYSIENTTKETREISIVQVQESLCGFQIRKDRQGVQDSSFVLVPSAKFPKGVSFDLNARDGRKVRGVEFYNEVPLPESDFDGCMAISAAWEEKENITVTVKPMFYSDDAESVLKAALQSGRVNGTFVRNVYSGRETISSAIVVTALLKPGEKAHFQFNTVLDFPKIKMNGLSSEKKYTTFFPEPFARTRAILLEALEHDSKMHGESLAAYKNLIHLPALERAFGKGAKDAGNLQSLALNTLSFLAEATVWDKEDRFLVRECADYPFFNSLDVYFYGSFSLLNLMPRLDGAVIRLFADAILAEDSTIRRHHEFVNHPTADLPDKKLEGPRSVRGAVIHDLGSPFDAHPDAYDWHNVKEWKDLAPKFVLMVLRNYRESGDISILQNCKEAVYSCIEYLERMVGEGQAFPLTHGTDDTFDNLSSHGISVYCGSLWIAGLRAASAIAEILGDKDRAVDWSAKSEIAAEEFHDALWDENEGYFHFFVTPLEIEDISPEEFPKLRKKLEGTLELSDNLSSAIETINCWLNTAEIPEDLNLSRLELRRYKKEWLTSLWKKAFRDSWLKKLTLDSDDVFADTMLADTYLRLLNLSPITDTVKAKRTLRRIYETNYKKNCPLIGAANLVHKDGSPLDESNFQAHDVWIGIQYSLATAMTLHNMKAEACNLLKSMERNLYEEARVPFAAPEGFNGSCKLHSEMLEKAFGLSSAQAKRLHKEILSAGALQKDSRISPELPRSLSAFTKKFGTIAKKNKVEASALFTLLHATALKYTAGKYFRPGMIFAVISAAGKIH